MACAMRLYIQLHTFSITSSVITRQEITKSVPVTGPIVIVTLKLSGSREA